HQAFVRQLANRRQGNHNTLNRGEVRGSTRKLFRQKGTGRARQGSIRAPHRRGGGIAHGPHPRDYRLDMPKKMRRLALKSVLSAKARDNELYVVENLDFGAPKTKEMVRALAAMGVTSGSTLVVTAGVQRNVILSARNIPWVRTLPANLINVADLINHRHVILTADAIGVIESIWGGGAAAADDAAESADAGSDDQDAATED
ncbi:MAG: 50S ribosomal protein L4, partial [Chloroflexi bacterium]|nr:50S ribosomal protein L4 [Chloroflexota bacterium]